MNIATTKAAVLWDLDGTIADTGQLHFQAWQAVLAQEGIDYSYEMFIDDFGRNNAELLSELLADRKAAMGKTEFDAHSADIAQRKEDAFRRLMADGGELPILPGVLDWLENFRAAGLLQAISSSGPMANITATLHKIGVADFFHAYLTGAPLPRGKPDPMLFLHSAAALNVEPTRCIVMDDSLHGLEGARRADMVSIAVGQMVHSDALQQMLAQVPGPPCMPIGDLRQLTWSELT